MSDCTEKHYACMGPPDHRVDLSEVRPIATEEQPSVPGWGYVLAPLFLAVLGLCVWALVKL